MKIISRANISCVTGSGLCYLISQFYKAGRVGHRSSVTCPRSHRSNIAAEMNTQATWIFGFSPNLWRHPEREARQVGSPAWWGLCHCNFGIYKSGWVWDHKQTGHVTDLIWTARDCKILLLLDVSNRLGVWQGTALICKVGLNSNLTRTGALGVWVFCFAVFTSASAVLRTLSSVQ